MASDTKSTTVITLNGKNYPTWKIQCKMALMRDGLWIVSGTERVPDPARDADKHVKYVARKERALTNIVLSVEPSLLYLLGEPEDPVVVWEKLAGQFQHKTWANMLELRRRLYAMRLKEGGSVQQR